MNNTSENQFTLIENINTTLETLNKFETTLISNYCPNEIIKPGFGHYIDFLTKLKNDLEEQKQKIKNEIFNKGALIKWTT